MRRNILIRIASNPPARRWSGLGDMVIPADAIETTANAVYLGGGELLEGLDDIEQLINGTAARLEIRVSGVTRETIRLALIEAADVKGADVDIGTVEFDGAWQPIGVKWQAKYRADKLSVDRQAGSRTITLSIGSEDTGRSRAPNAYFTDADQRRRSPTDAIFSNVAGINSGTTRKFGPR